jgi:hypothetical protein
MKTVTTTAAAEETPANDEVRDSRATPPATTAPASASPARGYSWPPFQPGHTASLKHGAESSRLLEWAAPEADALTAAVIEASPHLGPEDNFAVRAWAITEVVVGHLTTWIMANSPLTTEGRPQTALEELRRWIDRAEKARARIGLDPASRAALAVDELHARSQAAALERQDLDEGRRLREAAEVRMAEDITPTDEGTAT